MPYDDPDPTDPNMLVGVEIPGTAESTRDMAYVFAEEFVRIGFNKTKLLRVFQTPFYAGAHRAYLELGDAEVEKIVDECLAIWGRKDSAERIEHGA
jgi:hypothetical protein